MYLRLAFRNVLRSRSRSLITLAVIASGCIAMIIAAGFIQDSVQQVRDDYIRDFLGHLRIYKTGFRQNGILHPFDYLIENSEALIQKIERLPHVKAATPRLSFTGLASTGDTTLSFIGQGLDPAREPMMRNTGHLAAGEFLTKSDTYEVMVGKGLAGALQLKPGDPLILLANTAHGSMNAVDVTVKGAFATSNKAFDDRGIRVPVGIAQKLLRSDGVESIAIFLDDAVNLDPVLASVRQLLKESSFDGEVLRWDQLEEADFVLKLVEVYRSVFGILRAIILIVVTLGIVNTMNMSVLERVGEIGTMMAMGTRRSGIALLFLFEGLVLGTLGGLMGCAIGYLMAFATARHGVRMPTPPGTTVVWIAHVARAPSVFFPAFGFSVGISLISAVLPAMKAARLEIVQALRQNI